MACTSKQQSIPLLEAPKPVKRGKTRRIEQNDSYDEDARKLRKHQAKEEAIRQLELRKSHALATSHRISFIR